VLIVDERISVKPEPSVNVQVKSEAGGSDLNDVRAEAAAEPEGEADACPPSTDQGDPAEEEEVTMTVVDKAAKDADARSNAIMLSSDDDENGNDEPLGNKEEDGALSGDEGYPSSKPKSSVGNCMHCNRRFHYDADDCDDYSSQDHCVQCGVDHQKDALICGKCLMGCDDCEMYLCPPCAGAGDERGGCKYIHYRFGGRPADVFAKKPVDMGIAHLRCRCGSGKCRWACCHIGENPVCYYESRRVTLGVLVRGR